MSAAPIAELVAVSKCYGPSKALDDVSMCLSPGELVAAPGPNGAGKTTMMSLLLGLRRPSGGAARLFGLGPRDLRARSRTGAMLQDSGVPGDLRVRELVDLFSACYPAPLPRAKVLGVARLEEVAGRRFSAPSGGQRQRVSFALALCGAPAALFLDEPSTGLARAFAALGFVLATLSLLAFARVSGSAALAPGAGTWLLVRLTVGSFPLLSPASRLATCSLPGAAGPMTNLIYLPLAFGSGLFLPLESVPPAVQQLAPALPSYHLGRLAWGAVGADVPSPIGDAAWLLGATAVLLVLAVFGFRREAVRRFS